MAKPPGKDLHEIKLVVEGAAWSGKSALVVRYVCGIFLEKHDTTVEDSYRKCSELPGGQKVVIEILDAAGYHNDAFQMRELYAKLAEFFFFVISLAKSDEKFEEEIAKYEASAARIRRVKQLADTEPLPAFLVVTFCDSGRDPATKRAKFSALAAKLRVIGYYEVSSLKNINVDALFSDCCSHVVAKQLAAEAKKLQQKTSGLSGALPWNWGKKAKWNGALKKLEYAHMVSMDTLPPHLQEKEIEQFRFPEPTLTRNPVAFYADLRKLYEEAKGRELADVSLHASEGGEAIRAHSVVLCFRGEYFRLLFAKGSVEKVTVPDIKPEILRLAVQFMYSDQLPADLSQPVLAELIDAGRRLGILDLVADAEARSHSKVRALASSEVVEKQTRPLVGSELLNCLSDVTIKVANSPQLFRLHRAILWARSEWFRALLDRWGASTSKEPLEISEMSPDTFSCIIEFLYTGRSKILEELAMEVLVKADMLNLPRLVQLAEIALQPVIDAGNAVAVYLAAEAHGAKQLATVCIYWMACDLAAAKDHEQWSDLSDAVKQQVIAESERLAQEKAKLRTERQMLLQMPCLLIDATLTKPGCVFTL